MGKYKLGMFLGRFQPFHNGHKAIVDKMLKDCERALIVIGSAQEKGTVKNPFPAWERAAMIGEVYKDKPVDIIAIPDRLSISNDSGWGDYVMEYLEEYGYKPDIIFEGNEVERNTWFKNWKINICSVSRLNLPISATLIRAAIIEKREDFLKQWCPPEVVSHIMQSMYWGRDFHDELR